MSHPHPLHVDGHCNRGVIDWPKSTLRVFYRWPNFVSSKVITIPMLYARHRSYTPKNPIKMWVNACQRSKVQVHIFSPGESAFFGQPPLTSLYRFLYKQNFDLSPIITTHLHIFGQFHCRLIWKLILGDTNEVRDLQAIVWWGWWDLRTYISAKKYCNLFSRCYKNLHIQKPVFSYTTTYD